MATIKVINADDRLVKDHVTVARIDRDLFDDRAITGYAHGVEVSQAWTSQVKVSNREEINEAWHVRVWTIMYGRGEIPQHIVYRLIGIDV